MTDERWAGAEPLSALLSSYSSYAQRGVRDVTLQFAVGLKQNGKTDHVTVDAEDALIAALQAKIERPDATIMYVRRQNRRGDARHPGHALRGNKP